MSRTIVLVFDASVAFPSLLCPGLSWHVFCVVVLRNLVFDVKMCVRKLIMQTNVAQEIMEIINILPEDKQRQILRQAEDLAKTEKKPTIWDKIRARSAKIPDEVWEKMPTDGSENLDHYLYGSPKK